MFSKPILFLIFNRPVQSQKVFEAIRSIKPQVLFIAADGPRFNNSEDEKNCHLTRQILRQVDWDCEVKTLFHEENLGCGIAVSTALNWFFGANEDGIILEDDCLPNSSFFTFCSEMLDKYRDDERIFSINGCNLGYQIKSNKSYTFSQFMHIWGWATWRRSANKIDYGMHEWRRKKRDWKDVYHLLKQGVFDFDINWYKLWLNKFNIVANDINFTWDWQWMYIQFKSKGLAIVPASNLVTNIGFDSNATHTKDPENPAAQLPLEMLQFPLVHPDSIKRNIDYEESTLKWTLFYHRRLPRTFYLKQLLNRLFKGFIRILKGS